MWIYGKTLATRNGEELMFLLFNRCYFMFQVDENGSKIYCIYKVKGTESKGQVFLSI